MAIDYRWTYMPILKWKQGERLALKELAPVQWDSVQPLIELLAIPASPGTQSLKDALPDYIDKIGKTFEKSIPSAKPIAIDTRWVAPGYANQVKLLASLCKLLSKVGTAQLIPVLSETMVAEEAAAISTLAEYDAVILRLQIAALDAQQIPALVDLAAKCGISRKRLHLLVDQHTIVYEDDNVRFATIRPYLVSALGSRCASVSVAGGSFPVNLVGYQQGDYVIPRVEWRVWQRMRAIKEFKSICFSDYAVTNPGPLTDIDPRQMNPSVHIRYATDDAWRLFKAKGFKKGPPNQYRNLCRLLLADPCYAGPSFCYGDACYEKASNGILGNGTPMSWRRDATSHHLALTASQV